MVEEKKQLNTDPIVYVVDDDAAVCDSMQTLFKSVSLTSQCYSNAEEFLEDLDAARIGCLVLDLRMPGMSGLELQAELRDRRCYLPIIFISGHGKISAAVRAMHAGAVDFLTKPVDDELLIEAVHKATRQDRQQRQVLEQRDRLQGLLQSLTRREAEVLEAVARGLSNKEIARELDISHKTVELHRAHMMEKMDAHSIAEVVQMHLLGTRGSDFAQPSEEEE